MTGTESEQQPEAPARSVGQVDLAQPLLAQVGALGDAYDAWVHKSISPRGAEQANAPLVEAGDGVASRWPTSLRLFRRPWLEALSHISWWMIPLIWLPVVAVLVYAAVSWAGLTVGLAAAWFVTGFALWTLAEYLLHRFVFHWKPRTSFGRKLHFLAHGIHHLDPWDPTRLVFPPLAGFALALVIFGLLIVPLTLAQALATMSGLLLGYVVYDLTHYYTHHARPKARWGKYVKAWHLAHHHKWPERLYGVSSPAWDLVFRTGRPDKVRSVAKAVK